MVFTLDWLKDVEGSWNLWISSKDTGVYMAEERVVSWGIKATVAFGYAIFFERHKAKVGGNGGHGLHGLREIPGLLLMLPTATYHLQCVDWYNSTKEQLRTTTCHDKLPLGPTETDFLNTVCQLIISMHVAQCHLKHPDESSSSAFASQARQYHYVVIISLAPLGSDFFYPEAVTKCTQTDSIG